MPVIPVVGRRRQEHHCFEASPGKDSGETPSQKGSKVKWTKVYYIHS
jgi:hypothetical protein